MGVKFQHMNFRGDTSTQSTAPANPLISDFWTPQQWQNKLPLSHAVQFGVICYGSSRKRIQQESEPPKCTPCLGLWPACGPEVTAPLSVSHRLPWWPSFNRKPGFSWSLLSPCNLSSQLQQKVFSEENKHWQAYFKNSTGIREGPMGQHSTF